MEITMATTTKSQAIIYPLSVDEKKKLCEEWQSTGLSRSAFMRERNLGSNCKVRQEVA
jgi:hypothetical protein